MKRTALSGRRIGLLTASASRLGGGVAEAVVAQAAMIRALGGEPVVLALKDGLADEVREALAPTPVTLTAVVGPRQIGFAPSLIGQLRDAQLDLLHLHGIWMYPSRAATLWSKATGRPYLVSPHGMLDPWITGRGRWKKAAARIGYERRSWSAASALHALTPQEASDIARESGRTDALVIPNPGPDLQPARKSMGAPEVLYLGRIHPKKNIGSLVEAWRGTPRPQNSYLTIAGWGEDNDVASLRRTIAEAEDESIRFVGPVFGEAKTELLRSARFLALPSLSEGLPMVVLEAWAAGTPTIMTDACHLGEGFAAGSALRCGTEPAELAAVLEHALAMEELEWLAMSRAAHELAAGRFSAATVAQQWRCAYEGLLAECTVR